jgi:Tfp pilus assembly protein PilN
MKHATGFALCLAILALTAIVTASVGMLINKEQDVALLQRRIVDLKNENRVLRARIESITLAEQTRAAGQVDPAAR